MQKFLPVRIRRACLHTLLLVLCPVAAGFSQSSGLIELFYGGVVGADLRIGNSGLNAISGTFEGIGGSFSQLTPGGESVRWNPVGLAYLGRSLIYSEWIPPIRVDLNPLLDVEGKANREMRQTVLEHSAPGGGVDIQDFRLNPQINLDEGQGNYAGVFKTKYFVLGGAVQSANQLSANISVSGTKFRAVTETSGGGTTIRLLGVLGGTLNGDFNMTGLSLAAGVPLSERFAAGVGLDNYTASITASATVRPEAQISSGSDLFFFNDPESERYDSLKAQARGAFKGDGVRWRFGAGYHLGKRLALDFALFSASSFRFSGDLLLQYDKILALNFNAGEEESFFNAAQLLDDDFTGTHPRWTRVQNLILHLPGQLAASAAMRWRKARGSLTYVRYYRDLALQFDYNSGGDSTAVPVGGAWRLGMKPEFAVYANLGVEWLQAKAGFVRINWVRKHSREVFSPLQHITAPLAGLAGGFLVPHSPRLRIDYAVSLGLTSFFRLATSYKL